MSLIDRLKLCLRLLFCFNGNVYGHFKFDEVTKLRVNDRYLLAFEPLSKVVQNNLIILDEKIKDLEVLSKKQYHEFFDPTLPWIEQESPRSEIDKIIRIKQKLIEDIAKLS